MLTVIVTHQPIDAIKIEDKGRLLTDEQVSKRAQGEVLDGRIGSCLNLEFYATKVMHIYGVDLSVELQRIAQKARPISS